MKQFISVQDTTDVQGLVDLALRFKQDPFSSDIGQRKTLGLIFFNPSLRTRLSTQKAALNLGMNVMVMNINEDGWKIEFGTGTVMDGDTQEHIKEGVGVMSMYCDVLGVRTFPSLEDRDADYQERIMTQFLEHSTVPVISLESATRHPLQSLADLVTIQESGIQRPKVAVTWAPHPRRLPQAVTNSFLEWIQHTDAEVVLTHPKGYELSPEFVGSIPVTHDQKAAFEGADFVYAKNWSSYTNYGMTPSVQENWTVDENKMALTNSGKFMHCLPVRRNVVVSDQVLDNSIVLQQAGNREFAAQAVLHEILSGNN